MAAYVAGTAQAIYPGDAVTLSSASLTGLKSVAFAVGPNSDGSAARLTIVNRSAVAVAPEWATSDVDAAYEPLYSSETGAAISVAATSALSFPVGTGFVRGLFASDPGATTVTLSR